MHVSWPSAGWDLPAGQLAHAALSALEAAALVRNLPGTHLMQLAWPASAWYWPTAHAPQEARRPGKSACVPLGHGSQVTQRHWLLLLHKVEEVVCLLKQRP